MRTRRIAIHMPTSLSGIASKARRDKAARFGNLCQMLSEDNLRWCFYQLRKTSAAGVDGVTFRDYEGNLEENLSDLVERLKGNRYRAKLVRRKHIPKSGGKTRPLGIPALEDKLLQSACAKVLTAIYEEDFLDCSWGYRRKRSAREASRVLASELYRGRYGWVVEADIKGFFNHIDHDWMVKMLEQRVADKAFIRLIQKWMKAGILEESMKVVHPATGTPQGGIISPVLANIYLHYVIDLWFEKVIQKGCRGQACIMRYADDFVCGFEHRQEAEHFVRSLSQRLGKFGLEVAPEKTRTLPFSRFKPEPNDSFEFLGFEFRWVKRRTGKMGVDRTTAPGRLRNSMLAFTRWIKENRNRRIATIMEKVAQKLRGYWNYYCVRGNYENLCRLYRHCKRALIKWLNRRSQKRSYTVQGAQEMLLHYNLPEPRITEPRYQPVLSI